MNKALKKKHLLSVLLRWCRIRNKVICPILPAPKESDQTQNLVAKIRVLWGGVNVLKLTKSVKKRCFFLDFFLL